MKSIASGADSVNSFLCRTDTSSSTNLPFLSSSAFAWAMTKFASSIADRYTISVVALPLATLRYGVSRKPYSLVRA